MSIRIDVEVSQLIICPKSLHHFWNHFDVQLLDYVLVLELFDYVSNKPQFLASCLHNALFDLLLLLAKLFRWLEFVGVDAIDLLDIKHFLAVDLLQTVSEQ